MGTQHRRRLRLAAAGAVVLGLAAGSYGVASAASGSGTGATAKPSTSTGTSSARLPRASSSASNPRGAQRSDETLLTGDTAAKVRSAALARVSGATVVRVETDADGHAAYEAHMTNQDGTPVTAYVDKQFDVVSVESR
jgi:hypothetical protein